MDKFKVRDQVKYKVEYQDKAPGGYRNNAFTIKCIHFHSGSNGEECYLGEPDDDITEGGQRCGIHRTKWIAKTSELYLVQTPRGTIRKVGSRQLIMKS